MKNYNAKINDERQHIKSDTELLSEMRYVPKEIITQDPYFLNLLKIAKNIAPTQATVLIQGESGTGKELLASYIHYHSLRKGFYIAVNCAALPEPLAESELFGHEKGAFTGAIKRKIGKFEQADNGTLVLDEISELSLSLQAKLLRVLQEKSIDRVGGFELIPLTFRLIAVSNLDLKIAVQEETFRDDLYYRINVIPLIIPPLRERKKDIPILAEYFLQKYGFIHKKRIKKFSSDAISKLIQFEWRGNVRELENTVERAILLSEKDVIDASHLHVDFLGESKQNIFEIPSGLTLKEMEKGLIYKTLKEVNDNRTHAAQRLGISIRTLRNKLNDYKLKNEGALNQSVS